MEQELFGNQKSTLGSSFETYEDSDDEGDSATGVKQVDVDKNILKYMLEAHAAQLGGSGPASNLLSQLGIVLPKPPPPTRVGNRKSSNKDQ